MKIQVPHEVLEKAVSRYELQRSEARSPDAPARAPRVICISRQCGAGGKSIATRLSERLAWPVWDSQIMHVLADRSKVNYQARMFEALDERTQGAVQSALLASFGHLDCDTYLFLLNKAIAIIGQGDAIIVGRGADIILPNSFRVRIRASLEARVRHMVDLWKVSEAEARARISAIDEEREIFRKRLSRSIGKRYRSIAHAFEIEIATDRIPYDVAAEAIATAARSFFGMKG